MEASLQGDTAKMGLTSRLVQLEFWILIEGVLVQQLEQCLTVLKTDYERESKQTWKQTAENVK